MVPRHDTGSVRNNVSSRGSSKPSPTYLPVARITRASSAGMAASRSLNGPPLLLAQPRSQNHQMTHRPGEPLLEEIEVIVPFREHKWGPPGAYALDHVVTDPAVAPFIIDQLLVKRLKLHPLVGIRAAVWLERRGLHE